MNQSNHMDQSCLTQWNNEPCYTAWATQVGQVMVESSDKMWSAGEGNGKPLCILTLITSWTVWKDKDRTLKDEFPRLVGAQYATRYQWRNNSRKNEGMEPKQEHHSVVDMTGDGSKVQCCKVQCCIGTWNIRSINQGKWQEWMPTF